MSKPFDRLQSVLKLEAQQGYKNKAVVGGIRQFVSFWVEQARELAIDEADSAFIEQTAQALTDYAQTPGNGRKMLVDRLIDKLSERKARISASQSQAPTKSIIKKAPPTKPKPPVEKVEKPRNRISEPTTQRSQPKEPKPRQEPARGNR
ncbi:MAG: ATP-dependent DNA helicase RecG, partial [Cellvibrionaceae bacterium]